MLGNVTSCLHSGWNRLSSVTSKVLSATEQLTHSVATPIFKAYSALKKQTTPYNRGMIYLTYFSYFGWKHHYPLLSTPATLAFAAMQVFKYHKTLKARNDPLLQKIFQAEDAIKTIRDPRFVLEIRDDLIRYFDEHPNEHLSETAGRHQEIKERFSKVSTIRELEIALLLAHASVANKKGGLLDSLEDSSFVWAALFAAGTALGYLQGARYF